MSIVSSPTSIIIFSVFIIFPFDFFIPPPFPHFFNELLALLRSVESLSAWKGKYFYFILFFFIDYGQSRKINQLSWSVFTPQNCLSKSMPITISLIIIISFTSTSKWDTSINNYHYVKADHQMTSFIPANLRLGWTSKCVLSKSRFPKFLACT